jgi:hypothetical protein
MKKGKRSFFVIFILVVVAVGLLGFNNIFQPGSSGGNGNGNDSLSKRVPCLNTALGVAAAYHIHPRLAIKADGKEIMIPANIGLSLVGCERVMHTHDATGEIHIEPNYYQEFTLGDFFAVWGKSFSRNQILDYAPDPDHEIVMTVDGKTSEEFENLILKDNQEIVIEYKKVE